MSVTIYHPRYGTRQNAKTWANKFRARILEPGIVSYEDQDCGKALLTKETIDRCINSFVGRPLILTRNEVGRPTYRHARVSPLTLEDMADGYISNVIYDNKDGWWYAEGTVHNEEAKKAIKDIGFVSCAYDVTGVENGGVYHNIPYNEEITAFEGEHLAIVDNPRYERATIRFNAKSVKPTMKIVKWIVNALTGQPAETAQTGELPEGAALQVDGKDIPVADLVSAHQKLNSTDGQQIEGSSEILVGEERVTVDALIETYKANSLAKANAAKEEDEKKAKENAAKEEDEKKEKEAKENAAKEDEEKKAKENATKLFKVNAAPGNLSAARENGLEIVTSPVAPDTMESRLNRGAERYGQKSK